MKISRYFSGVILIIMLSVTSLTSARFLTENGERVKRQTADVRIAEYNALLALGRRLHCKQIACGLVNVIQSGRKKRSLRTLLDDLDEAQRLQYLNMLLADKEDEPLK
ncbi:hypothetical protein ACJMK2_019707 [Sinanodonta woodiana]|uniref:Uncharacterized protein n=1 Tax=Sinanodonta woodiana TaxID=1069815 RepID=A0ABD3TWP9_SINWO